MHLLEAIIDINHRARSGDNSAALPATEFTASLPLVALTCIDARLNRLFPEVLGIAEQDFIWLRNAGNIIFGPTSSMMRTLALACAVKGGREIAIIGHTDCRVRATTVNDLIDRFRDLGIERSRLPENLVEFFGLFASERQNVMNAVAFVRQSPLIGPRIPVHGLLVDVQTGRLEWLVNGYQVLESFLGRDGTPGPEMVEIGSALPPLDAVATTGVRPVPDAKPAPPLPLPPASAVRDSSGSPPIIVEPDQNPQKPPTKATKGTPPRLPLLGDKTGRAGAKHS